jgi:hypothetical protein
MGNGNLTKQYYIEVINYYRPDYKEKIEAGQYPGHLAKDGQYQIVWLSEDELSNYSIFNCTDEDFSRLKAGEFFGWPVLHEANGEDCGITPKIGDGRDESLTIPYPDWSNWHA